MNYTFRHQYSFEGIIKNAIEWNSNLKKWQNELQFFKKQWKHKLMRMKKHKNKGFIFSDFSDFEKKKNNKYTIYRNQWIITMNPFYSNDNNKKYKVKIKMYFRNFKECPPQISFCDIDSLPSYFRTRLDANGFLICGHDVWKSSPKLRTWKGLLFSIHSYMFESYTNEGRFAAETTFQRTSHHTIQQFKTIQGIPFKKKESNLSGSPFIGRRWMREIKWHVLMPETNVRQIIIECLCVIFHQYTGLQLYDIANLMFEMVNPLTCAQISENIVNIDGCDIIVIEFKFNGLLAVKGVVRQQFGEYLLRIAGHQISNHKLKFEDQMARIWRNAHWNPETIQNVSALMDMFLMHKIGKKKLKYIHLNSTKNVFCCVDSSSSAGSMYTIPTNT